MHERASERSGARCALWHGLAGSIVSVVCVLLASISKSHNALEALSMKILCLGAGATGGYFCGRLVEAGAAHVTFLVREGRKAQLERDGLVIESQLGNARLQVEVVTADSLPRDGWDFVILTCKAYDLDSALDAIAPAVGPNTAVLPLLNGLSHIERLNARFGRERVLGGMAAIHIGMQPDGTLKHLNDWHFTKFGEQSGEMSARVLALKSAFDACSAVKAEAVPDIMQKMWEKLVFLSTLAGMTCLMRANLGEIVRADGGARLLSQMLERNALIAARSGYHMPETVIASYRAIISDPENDFTASMLRDIERKGPVEADHIVGFMLERARSFGIEDTLHTIAYVHLKAYEERRKAGRL